VKRVAKLGVVLSFAAGFILAESWTGKLVDANCAAKTEKGQKADCSPTAATTSFAIETPDGRVLKLDSTGNSKATEMVKSSAKPNMQATVSGELQGTTVKVDTINIQ
jgi:hypothetical protein